MMRCKSNTDFADGLLARVLKYPFMMDDEGRYLPYCSFATQRGVPLRPITCEKRECSHYHKLYINPKTLMSIG